MTDTFTDILSDIFDIRDVIARFEELDQIEACKRDEDDQEEYTSIFSLLENVKGNGGDEQWRGDWYPVTFIKDSYFEEAMDELLEDIGEMPKYQDIPAYLKITVDYDALKMDYSSVEIDSETYWYR